MQYLYCLFLDRENAKEGLKTILKAIEYVKNGISIFIFPEGTRNKGEELSLLPFKDGAFRIATKTGCPLIGVCFPSFDISAGARRFLIKSQACSRTFSIPFSDT